MSENAITPQHAEIPKEANEAAEQAQLVKEELPTSIMSKDIAQDTLIQKYDLSMPEGMDMSPQQRELFEQQALDLELSPSAAQKLLDISHQNLQGNKKAHMQQVAAWEEELRQDTQLGGAAFESTVAYAKAGLKRFDPDGQLLHILDNTGYGNNPHVVRFLHAIGKAHAEDGVILGSINQGSKPRHERLYGKYNHM